MEPEDEGQSLGDSEFCAGPNASLDKACPGYSKINSFRTVPSVNQSDNGFLLGQETEQLDKDAMNEPESVNKWSESEKTIEENSDYNQNDMPNDSEILMNVNENEVIEDESQVNHMNESGNIDTGKVYDEI